MKTVMDEARTEYSAGKVNNKFHQFADDYGFKFLPCIAGHPHTKAKVEAPMKILDEIRAYNGKLNYRELVELVTRINNRVNAQVNQGTGRIPLMYFNREKAFLNSLPADTIRKPYKITTNTVKVNHSGMFYYKGCQYSVPPEYVGKIVSLQVYDGYIPEPPFICYLLPGSNNFSADGKVYYKINEVHIELYTDLKDLAAEEQFHSSSNSGD